MSFYKKKLEEARKQVAEEERLAKLEGGDSKFGAPTATQQKSIQQEGLMRPKARPGTGGEERQTSLGMQLMRQMSQGTDPDTHLAPDESLRPQARPGSTLGEKRPKTYSDVARPTGEAPERIKSKLVARGLPEHIAEAFVLNMADESGFDAGVNEKNPLVAGSRGGFGLYQLTGQRRKAFEAFAAAKGVSVDDEDTQLDFMMKELATTEKGAAKHIYGAANTSDAAVAIVDKFLRPAKEHRENRITKYKRYNL